MHALPPTSWVRTDQLMEHLQVKSPNTITRLIREGLPAHRIGRTYRFDLTEVDAWFRARVESRWSEPNPGETA